MHLSIYASQSQLTYSKRWGKTTIYTNINTREFRVASKPNLYVFGLGEETGALWGNPHSHKNNIKSLHRKALVSQQDQT